MSRVPVARQLTLNYRNRTSARSTRDRRCRRTARIGAYTPVRTNCDLDLGRRIVSRESTVAGRARQQQPLKYSRAAAEPTPDDEEEECRQRQPFMYSTPPHIAAATTTTTPARRRSTGFATARHQPLPPPLACNHLRRAPTIPNPAPPSSQTAEHRRIAGPHAGPYASLH